MGIFLMKPAFKDYLWGGTRLRDEYGKECDPESAFTRPIKKPAAATAEFKALQKKSAAEDDIEDLRFTPKKKSAPIEEDISVADNTPKGGLTLKEDEKMNEYYEKASQLVDGTAETAAAAVTADNTVPEAADKRQGAGQRPRRRRPAGARRANVSSDASLEDLMKLMEQEQNKLKNQMK